MTLFQQGTYGDYAPPLVFSVITWGAAASAWLASVLNECPRVYCVHAQNYFWRVFGGAPATSGLRYLQIVGMQGHSAMLAGDVHGIDRSEIPAIRAFFGSRFNTAVLVREPRSRLMSAVAHTERYLDLTSEDVSYIDRLFPEIVLSLPSGSKKERAFVHAANMLNAITEEVEVGPVFRMEDVVSSPGSLVELVAVLSGGKVDAPEDWAVAATGRKRINSHKGHRRSLTDWEISIVRAMLRREAILAYERLGYDLGWLDKRGNFPDDSSGGF